MKIRTFNRTWPIGPRECIHEWRMFGTRLEEEVFVPIRNDGKPEGYHGGFIICDKCGWDPHVRKYEMIGRRPYKEPLLGMETHDVMVKVIEWGDEKEPIEPVVQEFAYAERSWWDSIKDCFFNVLEIIAETLSLL